MIIQTDKPLAARRSFDFYPTPSGCVHQALGLLAHHEPETILDPSAGTGVWATTARRYWPRAIVTGLDVQPFPQPAGVDYWFTGDFLTTDLPRHDLIASNPPFNQTEAFIRRGMQLLNPGGHLMYLLPLRYLEGQKRAKGLWAEHPPHTVAVLSKRPSFDGKGTDASAYALYVWQEGWLGRPRITWL